MTRWPWTRNDDTVAEKESTPELDRVRRLAQQAAELGAQVERELEAHIVEGHNPRGH